MRTDRTPHGLWLLHRAFREHRERGGGNWWLDEKAVESGVRVYIRMREWDWSYAQMARECAYRYIRRNPGAICTVTQFNALVMQILKRAGWTSTSTQKAATYSPRECRPNTRIVLGPNGARPQFFLYEIESRRQRWKKSVDARHHEMGSRCDQCGKPSSAHNLKVKNPTGVMRRTYGGEPWLTSGHTSRLQSEIDSMPRMLCVGCWNKSRVIVAALVQANNSSIQIRKIKELFCEDAENSA